MAKRKCVGCGVELSGHNATGEHALPDWLAKEIYIPSASLKHYLHDEGSGADALVRSHSLGTFEIKKVCFACNTGWMSNLEVRVKPLLLGLMDGRVTLSNLSASENAVLSDWAVKTAFMIAAVQSKPLDLPWHRFQSLRSASGSHGCLVFAAHLPTLPNGFSYTCQPNELPGRTTPVQVRIGFYVRHLHFVVIIPIFDGPRVARISNGLHIPLCLPDGELIHSSAMMTPRSNKLDDFLNSLTMTVEAAIITGKSQTEQRPKDERK